MQAGRDSKRLRWPVRATALAVLVVSSAACNRDRPGAPAGSDEAIEDVPPPAPTLSRLEVPLDYDFTPILREVERVVPRTFGSLDELRPIGDDRRRLFAFEVERGPFTTFMQGSEVHLRTRLAYAVRGVYNPPVGPNLVAGCGRGDERPEVVVELVTPLTVLPNWHLRSEARLSHLAPASDSVPDRCRVTFLRIDVTDRVVEAARQGLTAHLPDFDREIGKIDITEHVTEWWGELNRPIRLTDDVWLLLQPRQLRAGRVSGRERLLTLRVGLDAYPRVVTGAQPQPEVPPLPPLGRSTGATGFHVVLDGNIDYATASRAITDALGGRSVSRAGRSVSIRNVVVAPAPRGRLTLTVEFVGDAEGSLRFIGTPRYDPAMEQIHVPDLDYDLDTDSRLVQAIAWLRSEELRNLFREHARVPVAPVLERGKALLTDGMNRKIGRSVTLSATVDSVSVEGLYVTRGGVVVRAGAMGDARVSVREGS